MESVDEMPRMKAKNKKQVLYTTESELLTSLIYHLNTLRYCVFSDCFSKL